MNKGFITIFSDNLKMKKKDHLGKKVHESKFYETFFCTFSASFPMVPLTPPLVASDPTTECVLFCIRFFPLFCVFLKHYLLDGISSH